MTTLQLRAVHKRFGPHETIRNVDLDVASGEFIVFVGPSGCGKSTLLRMIAGLESVSAGEIRIGGVDRTHAHPSARGVAMVFQSYALYPHMTTRENLSFGMRMRGEPRESIARKLARAVALLQLEPYLDRKPGELSGGQCQRIAIGRALVQEPQLFLFDEPLSNLDAELRLHLRLEIAALHRQLGSTMVYVTHDQVEAMTLADRIVVLRDGCVEQVGAPMTLYHRPATRFVAGFIGSPAMNFVPARPGLLGATPLPPEVAELGIRCEDLLPDADGLLHGRVEAVENLGAHSHVHLCGEHGSLCALWSEAPTPVVGAAVRFRARPGAWHAFDAGGRRVEGPWASAATTPR